jgi:hypothetical protein
MVMTTDTQPSKSQTINTRRRGKIIAPVKPPLFEILLSTFLYVIGFLALAYSLWSGYTMTGLKLQEAKNLKENIQGGSDTDQPVQQIVIESAIATRRSELRALWDETQAEQDLAQFGASVSVIWTISCV